MTIIDAKRHGARQCWACWQWTKPTELREHRCRECRKEQPEDWVAGEATTACEALQGGRRGVDASPRSPGIVEPLEEK